MALLTNINGKFSVSDAGAVTFNNAFTFPTADGTANYVLKTNGSGQLAWGPDNDGGDITGSGTANKVTKFTGAKTIGDGPITFATNDSTFAGTITSGNVTVNGSSRAQVVTSSNDQVVSSFICSDNPISRIGFKGSTSTNDYNVGIGADGNELVAYTVNSVRMRIDTSGNSTFSGNIIVRTGGYPLIDVGVSSTNYFRFIHDNPNDIFKIGKNGAATGSSLVLNAIGSLGIGVVPSQKLEVNGAAKFFGATSSDFAQTGGQIDYYDTGRQFRFNAYKADATGAEIVFNTGGTSSNYQRMVIDSSGNVGIGTPLPFEKLDVSAKIYAQDRVISANVSLPNENLLPEASIKVSNLNDIYANATKTVISPYEARYVNNNTGGTTIRATTATLVSGVVYTVSIYYKDLIGSIYMDIGDTAISGNYKSATGTASAPASGRIYGYAIRNSNNYEFIDINLSQNGSVTFLNPKLEQGSVVTEFIATTEEEGVPQTITTNDIIATGNVGIGTDDPGVPLHVVRTTAGQALRLQQTGSNLYTEMQFQTPTGNMYIFVNSSGYSGYGGANATNFYTSNGAFAFHSNNGNNHFYIANGGNVGIGFASPNCKFHVVATSTTEPTVRLNSTGYTYISYADPYHGLILRGIPSAYNTYGVTAGDQMSFLEYGGDFRFYQKNGLGTLENQGQLLLGTWTVKGDVVAYGSPSDKRLKENIKPIESALDKVSKLQGVTFDWIQKEDQILDIKNDIGFIAQDVQKVIPELVRENKDGMLSMRHQGIAPILLEAIKELKAEIEELKKCKCDCKK